MLKSRLEFHAFIFTALLLTGCSGEDPSTPSVSAKNLLLVTLDTVRADHLGSYGYGEAETPWLDRLAREGIRFAEASSPVPLTLPSHSSLLTGLLPPHHGLRNNGAGSLPEGTATLATFLAGEGYRTGAFVGAFVLDHRFGLARGFEVYDDEVERDPAAGAALEDERPGSTVVDRALAWLGAGAQDNTQKDGSRPFFLWVHLYDAHAPYAPPSPFRERHPGRPYDGEIASVDAQVGRLLQELESRGLAGTTLVAVASDHGEGLGEHGESTHGLLLYEPTLRVPLLMRAPGLRAGRVVRTPVSLVDVAPTLAGLLGKSFPAPRLDGRDLSAALRQGEEPPPADLYAETRYPEIFGWSPLSALRRRNLKYIASPEPELYNLERDPGEVSSLAGQEGAPAAGFAARLAEVEAGAVEAPRGGAVDAETRARLASLGYASGAPPKPRKAGEAVRGPNPRRMVALFERFEQAHNSLKAGPKADEMESALAELEALVAADPENPVFRGELAKAFRQKGEMAKAVPLYRQAAEDAPEDPDAWYNLATALQEAGRAAEAREAIRRAMHLDPARPEAHNTLGIVLLAERKPEEARQEFELAVAIDPRNAAAFNNLGNVLRGLGRIAEAESAYRKASAVAPRYAEPLNGLGTLEVERDRPSAALSYFERALQLAPEYHEIRLNRGIAHELAGEAEAAAAAYRDFLAATSGDPQFAQQRRIAQQLLARLSNRAMIPERR
ncbi:MAG TPA: sulfatase-like hydrolase/transferase [Thermoanaerobaculia bacterium]